MLRLIALLALAGLVLSAAWPLAAQEPSWSLEHLSDRIPRAELDAITGRGRQLVAHDMPAWHGTDAVLALHPAVATSVELRLPLP